METIRKQTLYVSLISIILLHWYTTFAFAIEPVSLILVKTHKGPEIDGNLDDEIWKMTTKAELNWKTSDDKIDYILKSQAMATYDDLNLYVAFFNSEPDTTKLKLGTNLDHDSFSHSEDHIELDIEVGNTRKGPFFRIGVYPSNITFDIWMPPNDYQRGTIPSELVPIALAYPKGIDWNPKTLETATHIGRNFWSVEIRIAFQDLLQSKSPVGQTWSGNFTRYVGWKDVKTTWSKTSGSFLNPEKFGNLIFAK